ncbi:MAG: TetR/AcrR family transcriptional regulator [Prevotellaceae bacterium]|jgi:AcrR family transcriptional regulator|nr:TetR/AcrR family transcriptional regulator [Prevotellaceae bacterium]
MEIKRKQRRKKKELDEIIWNALENLIIRNGFNEVTFTKLAQEAKVEPPIIYNRFENVDELFEKYIRKYDYWLSDIFKLDKGNTAKENCKKLFVDLINELYDNEIMQRILLWELNDTHRITRRIAQTKEIDCSDLTQYFSKELENFEGVSSLVISGIYYLILHRKVSTFSNINYHSSQGKKILIKTVESIVDKIFPENTLPADNKTKDIAKKLLEKGVDKNIVQESTGLSMEEIDGLINE